MRFIWAVNLKCCLNFLLRLFVLVEEVKTFMQTDPVCGMEIEERNAAGQSEYQGRTFYFCSSACKEQFDANPTQFITNESENQ